MKQNVLETITEMDEILETNINILDSLSTPDEEKINIINELIAVIDEVTLHIDMMMRTETLNGQVYSAGKENQINQLTKNLLSDDEYNEEKKE